VNGRIGRHIRSNVVGYAALFIALGGVTYAAGLAKDSVKAKQIAKNAVRGAEVKDNALKGADIDEGSLTLPAETGQTILDKLKTVDGAGSGLSADSLDSLDSSNLYTKTESDDRYPLAEQTFFNQAASSTGTYTPFVNFAELNMACDAAGNPTVALKNISGSNLRVYSDVKSVAGTTVTSPLVNGALTTFVGSATADNTADHITYLARGGVGTVRIEAWPENLGAPNTTNCIFNVQALGQGTGLALAH
jgi:hypothetical protein